MNIVLLQSIVERASECSVEDGGCEGECNDEECRDRADYRRSQASKSAEECEHSDKNFDNGRNQSNDVCDEHPLGHGLVGIQPISQLFAKELIHPGIVQSPDLNRIKPELVCVWRAESNIIADTTATIRLEGPVAVVPQMNVVKVLDIQYSVHSPTGQVVNLIREGIGR